MAQNTAPIQQAQAQGVGGQTTTTVTLGAAPVAGNSLIGFFLTANIGVTVSSIAQTGVTWTKVVNQSVNSNEEIWLGIVAVTGVAGTAVVFTHTSLILAPQLEVHEWPGKLAADVSGGAQNTNANPATGTITPTAGFNSIIVAATRKGGTFNTGPTNGFTALATLSTGSQFAYNVIPKTAGTYSVDWTFSASTAWDVVYAVFKIVAGNNGALLGASVNSIVQGFQ